MAIRFNKFLIPVDFSVNTELAIKKAFGLIGSEKAVLHLLHVVKPHRVIEAIAMKNELEALGYRISEANLGINVKTHVLKGRSALRMMIECARMLEPDLIIIGKHNARRRWGTFHPGYWLFPGKISPDILAQKSNCPVLTAKPGSVDGRTRTIVIPIRNFLPERKLEWAIVLARKFRAQVHLLALRGHQEEAGLTQSFLKAYHFLREHLQHPIGFSVVSGHDMARATLEYAEKVMADLILVNPTTESEVRGFTGSRHISDLLNKDSKIQVLDVEPLKNRI